MATDTASVGYSHTQRGPLCLLLYGPALVCFAIALIDTETPGTYISAAVGACLALLAPAFHYLAVEDRGDVLAIRFGPLPLFRRIVSYADIEKVAVGRTTFLDGWGIHYSLRGGWVWNLWGRDCAVVRLRKGLLRIGTDDGATLARFLEGRSGKHLANDEA